MTSRPRASAHRPAAATIAAGMLFIVAALALGCAAGGQVGHHPEQWVGRSSAELESRWGPRHGIFDMRDARPIERIQDRNRIEWDYPLTPAAARTLLGQDDVGEHPMLIFEMDTLGVIRSFRVSRLAE